MTCRQAIIELRALRERVDQLERGIEGDPWTHEWPRWAFQGVRARVDEVLEKLKAKAFDEEFPTT